MSARVATHMTAEEYFAVSTEGDRTQLIDGVMIVDEPLLDHGLAQGVLYGELYHWTGQASARGYAGVPADVVVSDNDVYAPDVWWLREERVPNRLAGRLAGLPDLAVEIRSPSTWRYVVGTKKSRYEAAGLPELWLVDMQAASVLQFRRTGPEVARFDIELELTAEHELWFADAARFRPFGRATLSSLTALSAAVAGVARRRRSAPGGPAGRARGAS